MALSDGTFKPKRPKTGGRQKGTPNKPRFDLWAKLNACGWDITTELRESLKACSPDQKVRVLLEMHKFIYPQAKLDEDTPPSDLSDEELVAEMERHIALLEEKKGES